MKKTLITALLVGGALAATAGAETVTDNTSLAAPGCYTGSGCINSGFEVSTDGTTELGLTAILRFIGPQSISGNTYTLPAGTSGGVALWDYTFSINTQYAGGNAHLSDYTYQLTLTDTANPSNTVSFDPLQIPDDDAYNGAKVAGNHNPGFVAANESTVYGAQNSENFSFPVIGLPNFDPNAADNYTITLTERQGTAIVNSDTINVDIVTPEPASFLLLGGGLLGGLIWKRRSAKASV